MKEGIKLYCDVDSTLINMGLLLQKDYPEESSFVTSFDEEPFLHVLFIPVAPRDLTTKITDKSISRFNKYSDIAKKILKVKWIKTTVGTVSEAIAKSIVRHTATEHAEDIGVFYSEEHELLCIVAPHIAEHVEASEVN